MTEHNRHGGDVERLRLDKNKIPRCCNRKLTLQEEVVLKWLRNAVRVNSGENPSSMNANVHMRCAQEELLLRYWLRGKQSQVQSHPTYSRE